MTPAIDEVLYPLDSAVCLCDADMTIVRCNAAAAKLTGMKMDDLLGRKCCDVMHNGGNRSATCPSAAMFNSRKTETADVFVKKHCLEAALEPLFDGDGNVTHVLHTFSPSNETPGSRNTFLKLQSLEHVGEVSRIVAHDLNNIMTIAMGNISLMKKLHKSGEDIGDFLDTVEQVMFRGTKLCDQLQAVSAAGGSGKICLSLTDTVKDVAELSMIGSAVDLELDIPETLGKCLADEDQISMVVANLIMNARQASEPGSGIKLGAHNYEGDVDGVGPGRYIAISVTDQGTGMEKERMAQIFAPFFTTKKNGTGLGMTAVALIAREHMGQVDVKSEPGVGTTVTMYIPAFDDEDLHSNGGRNLSDVLHNACFCMDLKADDKEGIIEEMVDALVEAGQLRNRQAPLAAISAREKRMSTGMQHGIALPHGRTNTVDRTVLAIGLKRDGVDFESVDTEPTYIVAMTVSPINQPNSHMRYLSEISQLLRKQETRDKVLSAKGSDDIVAALKSAKAPAK